VPSQPTTNIAIGPRVEWHQVEAYNPSGEFPIFVVTTNAHDEAGFRKIVEYYRTRLGYGEKAAAAGMNIEFFPENQPPPQSLVDYLKGIGDEDSRDDAQLAEYSCNNTNGYEDLAVYLDEDKKLSVDGAHLTELLSHKTLDLCHVVVRVDVLTRPVIEEVAAYYENRYQHPTELTTYFTTSNAKWRKYPRVYPAKVPKEIGMVYSRTEGKVEIVEGSKFK
jgi:hypothetical protein